MKMRKILLLLSIFFLALFLRLYHLDSLPYGFHVDEAKAAWNAYSIMKNACDDHGIFLPLYYNSFGDFRPTGIIYAIVPSLLIFANTVFAVRFPAALFGALTIFPLFLIFLRLAPLKYKKFSYLPALFLAINPWHIMVSRATSEVVIAMFFALFALYFFLKLIKEKSVPSMIFSFIFTALSYFFYHSVRVLAPMFFLASAIFYFPEIKKKAGLKLIATALFATFLLTAFFFSRSEARGRFSQVSLLSDPKITLETTNLPNQEGPNHVFIARLFHNKYAVLLKNFLTEYSNYFSTNFLTGDQARPIRYTIQNFGLTTYVELVLILLSLCLAASHKEIWLFWLLLFLSPLSSAVTNEDTPNLHRALFMLPFMTLLASYGFIFLSSLKKFSRFFLVIVLLTFSANFIYFWHTYSVHQKFSLASYYRDAGNLELADQIFANKQKYSQIIITNYPDDLYPWLAFFNRLDPSSFNTFAKNRQQGAWNWENITFSSYHCPTEKSAEFPKNSLIIDAEGCQVNPIIAQKYSLNLVATIRRPDLSDVYLIWEKN